jgi:SAM-dependent methyltransferase
MNCRVCGKELKNVFVDLGHQPPSNSFLSEEQLAEPETYYPLKVFVCDSCFHVQAPEYKHAGEIFRDDYIYHSSQSPSNVRHAEEFVNIMCSRFSLDENSKVLEIGSNDGYMLQFFDRKGVFAMGLEPSRNLSEIARARGCRSVEEFFSAYKATDIFKADLICGINVIAHTPDIMDFVKGIKIALKPEGVAVFEFPSLANLVAQKQFDTCYMEHFSYFSLLSISMIFQRMGLVVFDAEEIPEHGGSYRIYATHCAAITERFAGLLGKEVLSGMGTPNYYQGFQYKVDKIKIDLVSFLIRQKKAGKAVFGYGAAAKGNTFLNYLGVRSDLLPLVMDVSPYKQGKYLPGSHIRVADEDRIKFLKPEFVLILAWNLRDEISKQLSYIREWNGKFVTAIPELEIF